MKQNTLFIKAEDVATILQSILMSDDEKFAEALEYGYDEIDKLADILQNMEDEQFVITQWNYEDKE